MEILNEKMLIAAEACFEMDPSPRNEQFWCNIWCNTRPKKEAGATLVQQQKHKKTQQNDGKEKRGKAHK